MLDSQPAWDWPLLFPYCPTLWPSWLFTSIVFMCMGQGEVQLCSSACSFLTVMFMHSQHFPVEGSLNLSTFIITLGPLKGPLRSPLPYIVGIKATFMFHAWKKVKQVLGVNCWVYCFWGYISNLSVQLLAIFIDRLEDFIYILHNTLGLLSFSENCSFFVVIVLSFLSGQAVLSEDLWSFLPVAALQGKEVECTEAEGWLVLIRPGPGASPLAHFLYPSFMY